MIIKNKIGCLDKNAINYDNTSDISCANCCVNQQTESILQKLIETVKPNTLESNQSYSSYAMAYVGSQPVFEYVAQAETYALQIGCTGFHEYIFNGKKTYKACDGVEQITNSPQTGCDNYLEGVTQNGIVIWSNVTELETQKNCCNEMGSEGYVWDNLSRKCHISTEVDLTIVGNHSVLGYVENIPVWYTNGAALEYSTILNCPQTHTHNIGKRTGYMSCKTHPLATSNVVPLCFDTETRIDGSLVFNNTNTPNDQITNQLCCQQWREYSFIWNGNSCQPTEFSLTWECIDSVVTEILDGSGYYQNFNEALTYCESNSSREFTYDCVNNRCEVNPVGDGQYMGRNALNDCLIYCIECNESPICCDTTASNCGSGCQIANAHNSCACNNDYCVYDNPNVAMNTGNNPPMALRTAGVMPGCDEEICLSFNLSLITSELYTNTNLGGDGIWREHSIVTVPNYWSTTSPVQGVYNIFTLPSHSDYLMIHDDNGNFLGYATHPGVSLGTQFTYELFYFDSGVLTEINPPYVAPPILSPNSYIIRITDNNNTSSDGQQCSYNFSFTINNTLSFIPNEVIGAEFCDIWGCTNAGASNYLPTANADNNTCYYPQPSTQTVYGCTDFVACNYDTTATSDDGSCSYDCYGCTDETALNFSVVATIPCNGNYGNYCATPGVSNCCCVYQPAVYGCTDPYATNYDPSADTDDGSCNYIINGCSNPLADNFDPGVTIDDGSCEIPGCTDDGTDMLFPGRPNGYLGTASNYDPSATVDDTTCIYVDCEYGCTDPTSTNYDPTATCDDKSCYGGCCGVEDDSGNLSYVITGFTDTKISDILWPGYSNAASVIEATTNPIMTDKYGVNPYYPLIKRAPSLGMNNGWTVINENLFTAYTINNIHYWDYSTLPTPQPVGENVVTRFAVQMTNCCPGCLYPDIKEEWTLGHVFPPQIENNVFIDRGQISIFEEYYRIVEINKLEDFDNYQGGFFNIIN